MFLMGEEPLWAYAQDSLLVLGGGIFLCAKYPCKPQPRPNSGRGSGTDPKHVPGIAKHADPDPGTKPGTGSAQGPTVGRGVRG